MWRGVFCSSFHGSPSSSQVPLVQWHSGRDAREFALGVCAWASFAARSTWAMTRSMSRPIARMPTPPMSRDSVGGRPHASGNVVLHRAPVDEEEAADPFGVGRARRDVAIREQHPGRRLEGLPQRLDQAGVGDHGVSRRSSTRWRRA